MSDNNIPKNKESALFSQMKVGNQKLYLDVTSKVNGLIERAISTTKNQLLGKVLLTQILTDATDTLGVPLMFIKPAESLGLMILNKIGHMVRLYYSKWKHHVKPHGVWDFKNNLDPFKSAARSDMSPFFWYNSYRGKQYKLFPHHKAGLLRFDDVGNMCYAATGKIVMSAFDSTFEKYLLRWAAEIFADGSSNDRWENFLKPIYTQLEDKPTRQWFDDPWDMKVIEWAYDIFDPSTVFPLEAFKFYWQRFV